MATINEITKFIAVAITCIPLTSIGFTVYAESLMS